MMKLASTLDESDRIRRLIRSLRVEIWDPDPRLYQWMHRLPPDTLHTLVVKDFCSGAVHAEAIKAVVASPSLCSVRSLSVNGGLFYCAKRAQNGDEGCSAACVNDFMRLPNLVSLQIGAQCIPIRTAFSVVAPLKRLSVSLQAYTSGFRPVMHHLRRSLLQFDLNISHWNTVTAQMLAEDLAALTNLHHLSIFQHTQRHIRSRLKVPFMDGVIKKLPQLESLYCSVGSFGDSLFEHIPSSLHSLRLETEQPCDEGISRICERKRAGCLQLRLLKLGSLYPRHPRPDTPVNLINQCKSVDISLELLELEFWATILA